MGKLPYPESGLACIKAPKGTGKTQALTNLVSQALNTGDRRVLVITHRIQLGRAICASLGINYIDETRDSAEGKLFGYGLCIDSFHPLSQAKFNPEDWFGAIVIIDECEQVIWYALNSSTCRDRRVAILQTLQELKLSGSTHYHPSYFQTVTSISQSNSLFTLQSQFLHHARNCNSLALLLWQSFMLKDRKLRSSRMYTK